MPVVSFNNNTTGGNVAEAAVQKADYKIEFPMKVHQTKGMGVKLVLETLMTARNDIRVHPISTLDNDLIQPDQLPGVESEEWNKYIFNKSVKKVHGKEGKEDFYVCHIAVSTVHKLEDLKAIDEVQMVLVAERIYVRARAFTSTSKKVPIGWLVGLDVSFSDKKSIEHDITEHLSSAGSESIVDPTIQVNVARVQRRFKKEAFSTKAWMIYVNSKESSTIQKAIKGYLKGEEKKCLALRGAKFVPNGEIAPAVTAAYIKQQNVAICSTAVVALDNIYPSGIVKPIGELGDWFDFLPSQDEQIEWKQLIDENFDTWMGGMQDTSTEYIKDIFFKSGKLCIVCKTQNANEVIWVMKEMTNKITSSLSGEQIAEMCGILGHTPSRNPRVDQLWQYTQNRIKKTPIDMYIPEDLDPMEINQFMTDMGMVSTANILAYQPASYALSPPATFYRKGKAPVQLEGPQASAKFWSKYRQKQLEEVKTVTQSPTRSPRQSRRQPSPTTITENPTQRQNESVSKAVETDLLQRLQKQEERIKKLHETLTADLAKHKKQTDEKFLQIEASIESMSNNTEAILQKVEDTASSRQHFETDLTTKMEAFMQNLSNMQKTQNFILEQMMDNDNINSPARKKPYNSIDVANNHGGINISHLPERTQMDEEATGGGEC